MNGPNYHLYNSMDDEMKRDSFTVPILCGLIVAVVIVVGIIIVWG